MKINNNINNRYIISLNNNRYYMVNDNIPKEETKIPSLSFLKCLAYKLYLNPISKDKFIIYKELKNCAGIFLLFNKINRKLFLTSSFNIAKTIYSYSYPYRLIYGNDISKEIREYGLNNIYLVVLEVCGKTGKVSRRQLFSRERFYYDIYNKPSIK